ncbi:hypothetical protein MaudCBS49596_006014 [Microsporum audouinii]
MALRVERRARNERGHTTTALDDELRRHRRIMRPTRAARSAHATTAEGGWCHHPPSL